MQFTINGGIKSIAQAKDHLSKGIHGVMIGRASYDSPEMFRDVDREIYGEEEGAEGQRREIQDILDRYLEYCSIQQREDKQSLRFLVKPIYNILSKRARVVLQVTILRVR